MFDGAVVKLRDARTAIERLQTLATAPTVSNVQITSGAPGPKGDPSGTPDPVAFAEAFSSCIAQVRSVGDAVLKDHEADKQAGFKKWRESKKDECGNDELLRFINDRRNADLHEGQSPLAFVMHPFSFSSDAVGAPPSADAVLHVDGTGPYWIVDQGTPHEEQRRVESTGNVLFNVAIADSPRVHLGTVLPSTEPVALLRLAEGYYANLLFEARKRFET